MIEKIKGVRKVVVVESALAVYLIVMLCTIYFIDTSTTDLAIFAGGLGSGIAAIIVFFFKYNKDVHALGSDEIPKG